MPLVLAACVASAYAAWDNVLSDNGPVRADAEAQACTKRKCADKHGLTKADRTPFGQSFEYTWRDGIIRVECRRSAWIFGERACVVVRDQKL
jgi:hypothetical protein